MEQYEIVIVNDTGGGDKSNLAGQGGKNEDNLATQNTKLANIMKYTAMQSARQLVVSKVGQFTRDNLLQRRIDTAVGLAENVVAFAINPVFGAINLAIRITSQALDYSIRKQKEYTSSQIMWERAGWLNRSRE